MYQANTRFKAFNERKFMEITKAFEEKILKSFILDEKDIKMDLSILHTPNHACLWNKIENIGKPCRIIEKNHKLALVAFVGTTINNMLDNMSSHLYRIEDISVY